MSAVANQPAWRPEDLGQPLPNVEHAVSVCLPTWAANVGYEEADPAVTGKMHCGYPRFFLHPLVTQLFTAAEAEFAAEGQCCFVFPSRRVAGRCANFVRRHTGAACRLDNWHAGLTVVTLPTTARQWAKNYWQHAGEIVSSRQAIAVLSTRQPADAASHAKQAIRQRIADAVGADSEDVFLFPSGMAAIFAAYRAFQRLRPGLPSVQFGFPYVDNLKVQERFGGATEAAPKPDDAVHFFPHGDAADLDKLTRRLGNKDVSVLLCEFPGNPLLRSPDLGRLRELADQHDFPLLVDDTLGTFVNVDVLPAADVLATSLTKYFSGAGDVMGGSLVLNRNRPQYDIIREALRLEYEDLFWPEDAVVLERNSRDFIARVQRINRTTEQLCDWLRQHPAVAQVHYPKYATPENYIAFLKPGGGYGGLFSIDLHDAAHRAPAVFDALQISKGPNLGCNFTLCCPFTLLAHYQELDFAERCGISRYLLRVAVGLEEPEWLIERFDRALATT
jgi:cystathionine gamma-synthase